MDERTWTVGCKLQRWKVDKNSYNLSSQPGSQLKKSSNEEFDSKSTFNCKITNWPDRKTNLSVK